MPTKFPVPKDMELINLFTALLDCKLIFKKATPWQFSADPSYITTIQIDSGDVVIAILVDHILGSFLGGRITRMPQNMIENAIKSKTMPEEMFMNLKEVMNVLSGVLNSETTRHVLLKDFIKTPTPTPKWVSQALTSCVARYDTEITLPDGKTKGKFSMLYLD